MTTCAVICVESGPIFPMVTTQIQKLAKLRAIVAQTEKAIAKDLGKELRALPAQWGFDTPEAFVRTVLDACQTHPGKPATAQKPKKQRRKQKPVSKGEKAKILAMHKEGKSAYAIAKALHRNSGSVVYYIKKADVKKAA